MTAPTPADKELDELIGGHNNCATSISRDFKCDCDLPKRRQALNTYITNQLIAELEDLIPHTMNVEYQARAGVALGEAVPLKTIEGRLTTLKSQLNGGNDE